MQPVNRRGFLGSILAATCASMLRFYPAPLAPDLVRSAVPPDITLQGYYVVTSVATGPIVFGDYTQAIKATSRDGNAALEFSVRGVPSVDVGDVVLVGVEDSAADDPTQLTILQPGRPRCLP